MGSQKEAPPPAQREDPDWTLLSSPRFLLYTFPDSFTTRNDHATVVAQEIEGQFVWSHLGKVCLLLTWADAKENLASADPPSRS